MGKFICSVCRDVVSGKANIIEHLRNHHAQASEDADRAEDQLEELGSTPEL